MALVIAISFLLSCQISGVLGLTVKPKEGVDEKLHQLDKLANAVSWHKHAEVVVPPIIKAKAKVARMARTKAEHAKAPLVLYVTSPIEDKAEEMYELVKGTTANGEPVWKEKDHAKWLFSGVDGRWHIGGVQEEVKGFACNSGYIHGSFVHKGVMPNLASGAWEVDDERLLVKSGRSGEISVAAQSLEARSAKARQIPAHQMFGGCGHHIPVRQLGLAASAKSLVFLGAETSTSLAAPDWEVTSGGGCSIEGDCAISKRHPDDYHSDAGCVITVNAPRPLEIVEFEVEGYFDRLTVNGQGYSGRGLSAGPENVIPSGTISWAADFIVEYGGWKMCLQAPPEHEGTNSYAVPGVGAHQVVADNGNDEIGKVNGQEPFVKVLKDGFFEVGCFFDRMLTSADKFGNDKDKYNNQQNVSIAKYNELVLKMEQKKMTPTICFQFCRTIRGMIQFGITNGNECYCTPYFDARPGDDGKCDVGCQGDPTLMCGNAGGKSTIWEMHLCGDTAEDLKENIVAADEALTYFHESSAMSVDLGAKMADTAAVLEKVGGLSGSMISADLAMEANEAAGKLRKAWMPGRKPYEALLDAAKNAQDLEGEDFTFAPTVTKAENAISIIKDHSREVNELAKDVHSLVKSVYPAAEYQAFGGGDVANKLFKELKSGAEALDFRIASYAMGEKLLEPANSVCSGKVIGLPMIGLGVNGCGIACEQTLFPTKCLGFSHFEVDGTDDLCFLFSELKDVEIFEKQDAGPSVLLQEHAGSKKKAAAVCKVKLTEINLGYKPKGELMKKTRCYGACSGLSARESIANFGVPSEFKIGGKEVLEKFS